MKNQIPHSPQKGRPDDESHPVFVYQDRENLFSVSLINKNNAPLRPSLLHRPAAGGRDVRLKGANPSI